MPRSPSSHPLQWQTFGYIPSALPDANCFGAGAPTAASFSVAQTPGGSVATSQLAPAPALTSSGGIRQVLAPLLTPLLLGSRADRRCLAPLCWGTVAAPCSA